ncbi:transcriptional regulator, TetR family [Lachnospiraceae bacterium XBB2008]|nr:TetR/AcrR family transcriptional regulator [Lachnospiraceae bacterium]SCY03325.1 transcriptional regulator, TetR family [Lachnospiraceae bacterium XBB2008]
MNEKFFDLKKEKQDRIINAALKVFAENGYRHCSTDDIVHEAGISKGLLFHYFGSKMNLYEFLYDYCVKFLSMELKGTVSADEKDYFNLMQNAELAKKNVLRSYPHMQAFIDRSMTEDDEDAIDNTSNLREELQSIYDGLLGQVDSSRFRKEADPAQVHTMLQAALSSVMADQLQSSAFNPDHYYEEGMKYINMLRSICY